MMELRNCQLLRRYFFNDELDVLNSIADLICCCFNICLCDFVRVQSIYSLCDFLTDLVFFSIFFLLFFFSL